MKLYLSKENKEFNPTNYETVGDVSIKETSTGNEIRMVSTGDTAEYIFYDEIPVLDGEQCTLSLNHREDGFYSLTSLKFYHNSVYIGDFITDSELTFVKSSSDITIKAAVTGLIQYDISNIVLKKVGLVEVEMVNSDDIQITQEVKDFSNIGDTKSGFVNNITIKYNQLNNDNLGFFTNISSSNIEKLVNGIRAVLTTDDGTFLSDGIITLKEVVREYEVWFMQIFFSGTDVSFFTKLSKTTFDVPHIYIDNTYDSKVTSHSEYTEDLIDESFMYGYVDDDYLFEDNSATNYYQKNKGFFANEILEVDDISSSSTKEWVNDGAPWDNGYSSFPSSSVPLVKHKHLLEQLHNKYGYTYEGEIFNDPSYYNLSTNVILNKQEPDTMTDIVFHPYLQLDTGTGLQVSEFSEVISASTSYFTHTASSGKTISEPNKYYDINDININNNYYSLYGSVLGDTLHCVRPTKNFKIKCNVKVDILFGCVDITGYIRVQLMDGLYNSDTNSATMNPYSWMINEDIYVSKEISTPYETQILKEIVVDELHFRRMLNSEDGYFVRLNMQNETIITGPTPVVVSCTVTYKDIEVIEELETGNGYWLDEQGSFTFNEQDFMKDFINKFNLIPSVDEKNKIITYRTFNDFYFNDKTELNWERNILRDKQIKYNYIDAKSLYQFENNSTGSNDEKNSYEAENDIKYGSIAIQTTFNNTESYKIENKISNLFFTNDDYIRGTYSYNDDERYPGFPLMLSIDLFIKDEYLYLRDGTTLDTQREKFDEKSKLTKSVFGYPRSIKGSQIINGHTIDGSPLVNADGFYPDINLWRGVNSGSWGTDLVDSLYPRYLGPINYITSDVFASYSEDYITYNTLSYSDIVDTIDVSHNLYDYYDYEIQNLIKPSTHTLDAFFKLTEAEYVNITMREKVYIDSVRYIIKKISKYNPKLPTKITLLSWMYQPSGWLEVYSNQDSDDYVPMFSTTDSETEITNNYFTLNPDTQNDLGFLTNYHKVGNSYKVILEVYAIDDVAINGYYTDGSGTDFVAQSKSLSALTIDTYEYEYVRTANNGTDAMVLSEMIEVQNTATGQQYLNILSIKVLEY